MILKVQGELYRTIETTLYYISHVAAAVAVTVTGYGKEFKL